MGCDQETVRAAEKIILPGDRDRLGCVTQIRVRATCQRDEFSLCTSKFESDHPSHAAVGLGGVTIPISSRQEIDNIYTNQRADDSLPAPCGFSLQSVPVHPSFACATLDALESLQATG